MKICAPVDVGLQYLFCEGPGDCGLSSSFAPLVVVALTGVYGAAGPEASITDRKFGWRSGALKEIVPLRRALVRLDQAHRDVLSAVYGPEDWRAIVDRMFGKGEGKRVLDALGDLAGVALLTKALATAFEACDKPQIKLDSFPIAYRETDAKLRERVIRRIGGRPLRQDFAFIDGLEDHDLELAAAWVDDAREVFARLPQEHTWKRKPSEDACYTAGGLLVAACVAKPRAPIVETIRAEAQAMFDAAYKAWQVAKKTEGIVEPKHKPVRARRHVIAKRGQIEALGL